MEQHMFMSKALGRCFETKGHQTAGDANKFKCTMYSGTQRRVQGKAEHSRSKYNQV